MSNPVYYALLTSPITSTTAVNYLNLFNVPVVDVRIYGTAGNSYEDGFATAIGTISSTEKTLVIPNQQDITADITVPANVTLKFMQGGTLNISTAKTVTINGHVEAGFYQIFEGAGLVVFGTGSVHEIYPEWWGIDGTADEVQIQAALVASGGIQVRLTNTYYAIAAQIDMDGQGYTLIGNGNTNTRLSTTADITVLEVSANTVRIENFAVWKTGSSTKSGVKLIAGAKFGKYTNLYCRGFKYGLELSPDTAGSFYNEFYNLRTYTSCDYGIYINSDGGHANENLFIGGKITSAISCVYDTDQSSNQNKFIGVCFEAWGARKFAVDDAGTNLYMGCRFEWDTGYGIIAKGNETGELKGLRAYQNFWGIHGVAVVCKSGAVQTDSAYLKSTLGAGLIRGGSVLDTTVDVESASGQKVLSLASTTGLEPHQEIVIDEGNANEEWGLIASVSAGVSVTLRYDLIATHAVSVAVSRYGKTYGLLSVSAVDGDNYSDIYVNGVRVLSISNAGVVDTVGSYQVDSVQVVGNRVVDARCDDAINTGDATSDGVIDALRDAMITHGLIAAS